MGETWPGVGRLPNFAMSFPRWPIARWDVAFPNTAQQLGIRGVKLVASLLIYDPRRRLSAKQALTFFEDPVTTPVIPTSRQATPRREKEWPPPSDGGDTQTPEKSAADVQ